MKNRTNRVVLLISLVIVVPLLLLTIWFPHPFNHKSEFRSVVWIESHSIYTLTAPGIDTLYFQSIHSDSSFNNLTTNRQQALTTRTCQGFWYSPVVPWLSSRGSILTLNSLTSADTLTEKLNRNIHSWLSRQLKEVERIEVEQQKFYKQMRKYMATHDVTDEGYNQLAVINQTHESKQNEQSRSLSTFRMLCKAPQVKISCETTYSYRYVLQDSSLSPQSYPCLLVKSYAGSRVIKLQTPDKKKPSGTVSLGYPILNFMRFTNESFQKDVKMYSFNLASRPNNLLKQKLNITPGRAFRVATQKVYATTVPILPLSEGAPVVNKQGVLIGIATSSGIIPIP